MISFAADELGIRLEDYMNFPTLNPNAPYTQPQFHPSQETNSSNVHSSSRGATSSSSTGSKRRRTSWVWVEGHFEYREVILKDGKKVQEAVCTWPDCNKILSGSSSGGTGHLERHTISHKFKLFSSSGAGSSSGNSSGTRRSKIAVYLKD